MRELIAVVAGLGALMYLMRNEKAPGSIGPQKLIEGFEPEIVQNTLNLIQEREPNVYPIDTVYFQKGDNSELYIGRFMFLNTEGFYGVQYDVETDGTTITSLKKTVPPEFKSPFSGYSLAEQYKNITNVSAPVPDMKRLHENLRIKYKLPGEE